MILGKNNDENEVFDVLLFVNKNIKTITIPPNIKTIGSYAFSQSLIENVFIQHRLTNISKLAFNSCEKLHKVEIPCDSEFQYIDEHAFSESAIENIFIPHFIPRIGVCAFNF